MNGAFWAAAIDDSARSCRRYGKAQTAQGRCFSKTCWGNGEARPLLNFTAGRNGQYRDSEGRTGSMTVAANGRVTIRGGNLDGFLPAGFYAVYQAPGGRPTLSFRNSGGSEVQYCQKQ